jgi:hypothetical protein
MRAIPEPIPEREIGSSADTRSIRPAAAGVAAGRSRHGSRRGPRAVRGGHRCRSAVRRRTPGAGSALARSRGAPHRKTDPDRDSPTRERECLLAFWDLDVGQRHGAREDPGTPPIAGRSWSDRRPLTSRRGKRPMSCASPLSRGTRRCVFCSPRVDSASGGTTARGDLRGGTADLEESRAKGRAASRVEATTPRSG